MRQQRRRPPGEKIEEQMEMGVGRDVEQREVFRCGGLTDWLRALRASVNRGRRGE
jgi:hypothetical protein